SAAIHAHSILSSEARMTGKSQILIALVIGMGLFCADFSSAQDWDGGGTTNNWSDPGNWNPDGTPVNAPPPAFPVTMLSFQGTQRTNTVQDFAPSFRLYQINFDDTFQIAGNAIQVYSRMSGAGGGRLFIHAPVEFVGSVTLEGGSSLTFDSTSGTGTLVVR